MAAEISPGARNSLAVAGLLLLLIGFAAGYYAGSQVRPAAPFPEPGGAPGPVAAAAPTPHRGHTFTGSFEAPPHSDAAHDLANHLLAEVPCPCGGCSNQNIGQCGCDTAREIGAVAAHLLERGKSGEVVLRQLQPRYGLALTEAVLAAASGVKLPNPQLAEATMEAAPSIVPPPAGARSDSVLPPDLAALGAIAGNGSISRPLDVPTDARPKEPPAGLAATVLDPALFAGPAAESYAIARRIPQVLQGLPCACGCMARLGHAGLLTCYQGNHAATCPICQAEAKEAERLFAAGTGEEAIRGRIQAEFHAP